MKKSSTVFALLAAAGIAAMSATPASAVTGAYPNCGAAAAEGVYNIPAGAPGYGPHLDRDKDGIGCENSSIPYRAAAPANQQAPALAEQPAAAPQVARIPVGGAATGVAQESSDPAGTVALGGGLVLAAALGGAYVVRRNAASKS